LWSFLSISNLFVQTEGVYIYSKLSFSASLHFSFLSVTLLRLGEKLLKSLTEAYDVHQRKYVWSHGWGKIFNF